MSDQPIVPAPARRRFLRSSGALIGAAAAAREVPAQNAAPANTPPGAALPIPESMKTPGAPLGLKLYGDPSAYENKLVRKIIPNQPQYLSAASRTPLQELDGISPPAACSTSAITAAFQRSIRLSIG